SEARMREVIREQIATSMAEFMANMNRGASGDEAGGAGIGGVGAGGAGAGNGGAGGAGITPCVLKSLTTSINLLFIFSVVRVCL
ncbi:hypothetical protein Tco_0416140, partial [Tanacetum coccineum]